MDFSYLITIKFPENDAEKSKIDKPGKWRYSRSKRKGKPLKGPENQKKWRHQENGSRKPGEPKDMNATK